MSNSKACALTAHDLCEPSDIQDFDGKLWVVDSNNNRILLWDSLNPPSGSDADVVLSQANMGTKSASASSTGLNYPSGLSLQGPKLFVADANNNRILIWNSLPTSNQVPASLAIGQPDRNTGTVNTGGIGAKTLSFPTSVETDGKKLVVADDANHRVLIWNSIPNNDNVPATVVLGQDDFSIGDSGTTATRMRTPYYATINRGRLYVSDYLNHRILVWNSIPHTNSTPTDYVLGQANLTSVLPNRGGRVGPETLNNPGPARVDARGRLFVADQGNNRVLVWNQVPSTSGAPADAVIGQPNLISKGAGVGPSSLNKPWGIRIVEENLWIVDSGNTRIIRVPLP